MVRLSMLATVFVPCVNGAVSTFLLSETINSTNFFDKFTFKTSGKVITLNDDNGSWVKYQNLTEAKRKNIASIRDDEIYLGVDHTNVLDHLLDEGRDTFRAESRLPYYQGLFIARFSHLPKPVCGSWPAFWTLGGNWPRGGEIDVYEGWHLNQHNRPAIHVGPERDYGKCRLQDASQSSRIISYNCDNECSIPSKQWKNQGCQSEVIDGIWGSPDGGTQALLWTNESIKIYSWKQGMEPSNIRLPAIDTSYWGQPVVHLRDCDVQKSFGPQEIIINIALCGNPIEQPGIWNQGGDQACLKVAGPDCRAYVAKNPSHFKDVYFQVRDIRYFKLDTQNQKSLKNEPKNVAGPTKVAETSPIPTVKPIDALDVTKLESITNSTLSTSPATSSHRFITETATGTTKTKLTNFSRPKRGAYVPASGLMAVKQPINTLPLRPTLAPSSTSDHRNRRGPNSKYSFADMKRPEYLSSQVFQASNVKVQPVLPTSSNLTSTTSKYIQGSAAISSPQAGDTNYASVLPIKLSGWSSGPASEVDSVTSSESSVSLKSPEDVNRASDNQAHSPPYLVDAPSLGLASPTESRTAENADRTGAEQVVSLTIFSKSTSTITACPPTVTFCPLNSEVIVDVPWYTTICPVTPVSKQAMQTPVVSGDAPIYLIGTVVKVFSILRCPSTVPNCPLGSVGTTTVTETHSLARQTPGHEALNNEPKIEDSSKGHPQRTRTFVIGYNPTTSEMPVSNPDVTGRPAAEEPTQQPDVDIKDPSAFDKKGKSNFKVTITRVSTISSCAPTMTDCSIGKTITQITVETRCPGPDNRVPVDSLKDMPEDSPLVGKSNQESSNRMNIKSVPNLRASEVPESTRATKVLSITNCPPTVADCSIGSLSTTVTVIPCSGLNCGLADPLAQPSNQPQKPSLPHHEPGDDSGPLDSLDRIPDSRHPAQAGSFKYPQHQVKNAGSPDQKPETHAFTELLQTSLERPQHQIETQKGPGPLVSAEPPATDGDTVRNVRTYKPLRSHKAGSFEPSEADNEDDSSLPERKGSDSQGEDVAGVMPNDLEPTASQNPPTEIQHSSQAIQMRAGIVAALAGLVFALI